MKLFNALFVVGSAALPALLSAASPSDSLYVHVPFDFVAAGQSFSPGDYRIDRGENGVVLIQGNGKAAATMSIPGSMAKPGAATGLKFSSDGQREHLVGVQVEGQATRKILTRTEDSKKLVLSSR
ncbi:MAG: hypothetical protein ACJ746_00035 [Bryobacteraceae bacterium]